MAWLPLFKYAAIKIIPIISEIVQDTMAAVFKSFAEAGMDGCVKAYIQDMVFFQGRDCTYGMPSV